MIDSLGRALESQWSAPLRTAGVKYRTKLVEADPVNAILGVAEGAAADLIVLGAQGDGGIVDRLLGGVTYKIAHRARQPVVIVPEGPR
jgi:nucleotide-binding universal stress UspA family protein